MDKSQKPASVRRMELINTLSQAINTSRLPPYVIEPILADLMRQARANTMRQYQADMARWKEAKEEESTDRYEFEQDVSDGTDIE